jgi:hypothetical protein
MIKSICNSRGYRGSRAVGLLIALALTTVASVLNAAPAAAADSCGTPSTSGGYSVTACTGSVPDGSYDGYRYYGYIYVTLPAGHASCTIRGKDVYVNNMPNGYAQTWICPSGAVTDARYDIDFDPNGEFFTRGNILTSSGYTIVSAESW